MLLILLLYCVAILNITDAVGIPVQVVTGTIEEINGSMTDMGCRSPVSVTDGATTCGAESDGFISYLIDGISPDINTSSSNWASQLVTARWREANANIPLPHVLLTFGFDANVSVIGIKIDLFNCPNWGIGVPNIRVYLITQYDLSLDLSSGSLPTNSATPPQSSCHSLSTVTINLGVLQNEPYQTFHIVITMDYSLIEFVYVGEVRFLGNDGNFIDFQDVYVSPTKSVITTHDYSISERSPRSAIPNTTTIIQNMEKDSGESSGSLAVIVGSAVTILLIVIIGTVILGLCLLIIRMRRSSNKTETYTETTNPITDTTTDVPVSQNEAYALTKITNYSDTTNTTTCATTDVPVSTNEAYELTKWTRPEEEVTYEIVI